VGVIGDRELRGVGVDDRVGGREFSMRSGSSISGISGESGAGTVLSTVREDSGVGCGALGSRLVGKRSCSTVCKVLTALVASVKASRASAITFSRWVWARVRGMAGGYDRLVGRLLNQSRRGFQNDMLTLWASWEACYRAKQERLGPEVVQPEGWDGVSGTSDYVFHLRNLIKGKGTDRELARTGTMGRQGQ
jgi:hypothetical protein